MGSNYDQFTQAERIVIGRLHSAGRSQAEIARTLARSPGTISRELRRNSRPTKAWPGGYAPDRAERLTQRRRRRGRLHKLARQPALAALVGDRLAMGWSPEQIAGRLALDNAPIRISHESIYRFIYHRSAQKDYWHRLLPKAKLRRGRRGRKGGSSVRHIKHRVPIDQRPAAAADRRQPGHWEADLMLFRRYGQAVLVAHERCSRLTLIRRQPNKASEPVLDSLTDILRPLPKALRRSLTIDNGTEFALHYQLTDRLGIDTFFCDPYAPWQKGGIENAIGRLRRPLPRKSDLAAIADHELNHLVQRYNHTPRKCLEYLSPIEAFQRIQNRVALET